MKLYDVLAPDNPEIDKWYDIETSKDMNQGPLAIGKLNVPTGMNMPKGMNLPKGMSQAEKTATGQIHIRLRASAALISSAVEFKRATFKVRAIVHAIAAAARRAW